jgi:peroxiredoxin
VTNDDADVHAGFAAEHEISYTLLADRGARIIGAFGLIDERMPRGSPWYGLAHPMTFVIGTDGVITHRFSSSNYRQRIPVDIVLETLGRRTGG